jgi:hypothetical protein
METSDTDKELSYGLPRQHSTLPGRLLWFTDFQHEAGGSSAKGLWDERKISMAQINRDGT